MSAEARAILQALRDRGMEVVLGDDRIRFRPQSAMTPELLEEVVRTREELLLVLRAEERASTTESDDMVDSIIALFGGEEVEPGASVPFWPVRQCPCCYRRRWWRRSETCPWVCARCHPPQEGVAHEWMGEDEPDE